MNPPLENLEPRRLLSSYTPAVPETKTPGNQSPSFFDLAVAGDGSYVVVSSQLNEETNTIFATRYAPDGRQIYNKILDSGDQGGDVSVATNASGDAVVAYALDLNKTTNGNEIYFKTLSASGTVGLRTFVAGNGTSNAEESVDAPQVAMDDSGRFYLGWIHTIDRSNQEIPVRFYNAAGTQQGSQFDAAQYSSPDSTVYDFDLATTHDGSQAAWNAARNISDGFETPIETGRISASAAVGKVQQVADLGGPARTSHITSVHLTLNDDGTSFVTYDTETGSWAQRYDATNTKVGDLISLGTGQKLAIARLPDGGFVADVEGIATNYDAAGSAETDPQGVGGGLHTVVGTDSAGDLVLAYQKVDGGPVFTRSYSAGDSSIFASLSGSKLFVDGTSANDNIDMTREGNDVVVERGNRSLTFASSSVTAISVHSFGGNDTITNETELPTTMDGGDGNDQIFGGTGSDRIYGGAGDDEIWGDDGSDSIWGMDGRDSLYGNGGNDRIEGGAQPDHIRGNGGNDQIFGGASGDFLYGSDGTDQLWGEGGDDHLYGDDGSSDTLHGGAGNDTFSTADNAVDQVFGDGGRDSMYSGDATDLLTSIEVGL